MIEISFIEMALILSNIVSWAMYFKTDDRRKSAESFVKAMIEDKEIRDKVVSEYEAFQRTREQRS